MESKIVFLAALFFGRRSLSFRVRWRGRSVAIRIAGSTVQVTQTNGEAMEMRIAGATRQLTAGAPLQVSL